ncbi:S8 family serine peptidase [Halobellus rubicundus]|uniref:S8 family serine peptidase n=1 Tax=Halobellus rubicundus TaxID=2996466 RepID=A0ABD5MHU6_9EURY
MTDGRDDEGFRISRRRALAVGGAAALSLASARRLPRFDAAGDPSDDGGGRGGSDVDDEPIARIHDAGVAGAGVDVAVLDPTGFDPTHDVLADAVADIRQFGPDRAVVDRTTHGTAAAAAVARLAPDAALSLASFREQSAFVDAVEWCRERGTDVILAPVAAHGAVARPGTDVYRAVRRAIGAGSTVVAPTGNAALGHWRGPLAAVAADGDADPTRLGVRPLSADGAGAGSVRGRFVAWLVADAEVRTDLTLALLRAVDDGERWNLVAVSQPAASRAGQRLVADLDDGTYALVVRPAAAARSTGGARTGRIEVTTPTHALSPARPLGSIAVPASVPGVVGVGVTDGDSPAAVADSPTATTADAVAPYSGRGPTREGGTGVDVVAPPRPWIADGSPGTSAAAARTAGVVALLRGAAPSLSPADVVTALRASAGDVGRPGTDLASGWGRLDAVAAVQRARSR